VFLKLIRADCVAKTRLAGLTGLEAAMTMKLADVAPNEAQLLDLAEQLNRAQSPDDLKQAVLRLDVSYVEAARAMLETLSSEVATSSHYVSLTTEQIESYLEFDPAFAQDARDVLKEFIERKESLKR
jgi:hypothetical protein